MEAVEAGFRMRVPATYLWFNVGAGEWTAAKAALDRLGAEAAQGGLDGEELCTVGGLTVAYRAAEERMQAEVGPEGGRSTVAGLGALLGAAPRPSADASPMWLWSPDAFRLEDRDGEPADRLLRAGRWLLPRAEGAAVFQALLDVLPGLDDVATIQIDVQGECAVSVTTPLAVRDADDRDRRAAAFRHLLSRLGKPVRADHVTWA